MRGPSGHCTARAGRGGSCEPAGPGLGQPGAPTPADPPLPGHRAGPASSETPLWAKRPTQPRFCCLRHRCSQPSPTSLRPPHCRGKSPPRLRLPGRGPGRGGTFEADVERGTVCSDVCAGGPGGEVDPQGGAFADHPLERDGLALAGVEEDCGAVRLPAVDHHPAGRKQAQSDGGTGDPPGPPGSAGAALAGRGLQGLPGAAGGPLPSPLSFPQGSLLGPPAPSLPGLWLLPLLGAEALDWGATQAASLSPAVPPSCLLCS